jgi:hypothetical protein
MTASTSVIAQQGVTPFMPQTGTKRRFLLLPAIFQLIILGCLLEILYLAFYPLLAFVEKADLPSQQGLPAVFSWGTLFFWPSLFPSLASLLTRISWLDPAQGELSRTNLWLLVLSLAAALALLAMRVGARLTRLRLSTPERALLLCCLLFFAVLFSLTMVFAPLTNNVFTHDLLLSSFYGRMVALYHVNPYVVLPSALAPDFFQRVVGVHQTAAYGPVWMDISMLATLFAQNNLANELLVFRLLGLLVHVLNCILLWVILGHLKPERRFAGVFFYAWNPLVLLLGVAQVHLELVLVLYLLLAVFFFLNRSAQLAWVFVLLAGLSSPLYFLLAPVFFVLLMRYTRMLSASNRFFWWIGILLVTALVVLLAYLPYWSGWGVHGILQNIIQVFRPETAQNSLDAALLHLPVRLPSAFLWILAPHHWAAISLVIIGLFLLFSLWLADTLEMVLLFASWLLLLAVILLPIYWPWYMLVPLVLVLASTHQKTSGLVVMLVLGALLCYYCWQWSSVWSGLALACLCLPTVLWGWSLFFSSTWQMVRLQEEVEAPEKSKQRLSRSPWFSRPSRPDTYR